MFQSIRNFFRDAFFGKDELPTYVWHNGQSFTITLPYSDDHLTQAELQMLQRIVAERIQEEDQYRSDCKQTAKAWSKEALVGGQSPRDFLYKEAAKASVKLKKLSALQYRLKHKIAARG